MCQRILSHRMMYENIAGWKRDRESPFVETQFDLFNQMKFYREEVTAQNPRPNDEVHAAVTEFRHRDHRLRVGQNAFV